MTPALATTYAPSAANDNVPMIGLTGLRNVGKSTVAELLEREYGFVRIHAFEAGKRAAQAWFEYLGLPGERMVYGDLKDKPHPSLPGRVAPRYFLERFGHFMGEDMGITWTLGLEIDKARRDAPGRPIVVESVVYEAGWFKRQGGTVWRLERPGHAGPVGVASDGAQAAIKADMTIAACSVIELERKARHAVQQIVGGG